MIIFNTLTRKKEELIPQNKGEYRIYACGPTVYNFIHIGNARPICVFDVLRRYLEWQGNKVIYVQNFTDIDDKLIRRANEEKTTVPEIAKRYIAEYFVDAHGLNIREATYHPKATENIDGIIEIIKTLVDKGYAYPSAGDVYFSSNKFDQYGKLSHQPLSDLEAGARIDVSDIKRDPCDFALWKAAKEGEPYWESPWGNGRPGWHIECSVMAKRYLGNTIDLHCGGQDLIFPHHENEIAQSECANGCEFSHYWMHNGYINVDNRKMSKSLGNFFTVRDVAEKYGYEPIRFLMISSHYRSPINYSTDIIEQSKNALARLYNCRGDILFAQKSAEGSLKESEQATINQFAERRKQFIAACEDDLNTADAISVVFELARDINTALAAGASLELCDKALYAFDELCGVLGLVYDRSQEDDLGEKVEQMIADRTEARKNKNYAEADRIRDELKNMGVVLEDTAQGIKWKIEK